MAAIRCLFTLLVSLFIGFTTTAQAANFDSVQAPLANFTNSATPGTNNQFVPVDQAFPFNFIQQDDTVTLDWQIKPGYYLYRERFSFQANKAEMGEAKIPEGTFHSDEFFGNVHIFTEPVSVEIPLKSVADNGELIVQYQGCATTGFCYPPETRIVPLDPIGPLDQTGQAPKATTSNSTTSSSQITDSNQATKSQLQVTQATQLTTSTNSADSNIASQLAEHWWTPLLFLLLGIGLAFTPCVLPMYPILTGIVLGGGRLTAKKAFKLSFIYVQGMALTYMLLGLVVASLGVQFQATLQAPVVLISLSIIFVLLSLSMFGLYTIQLPSRLQTWLNEQSNKQQGGNLAGVFIMGVISGLVCSPCTTAPLSGALLYVAQSGDLLTGAIALYALAIGMGIPLIIVAVFGNKLLPKAGEWMNRVKVLFGFILLAAPIFLLERILPEIWTQGLWITLGLISFAWLYHVKQSMQQASWQQSLIGIVAILGLVFSAYFGLQTAGVINSGQNHTQSSQTDIAFTRISTVSELDQQLAQAKAANKPVMFDFYADWCVACKEFEKYTFHAPKVANELANFVLIQADVTAATPDDIALMEKMKVLGLPTIEFWDAQGEHIPQARIAGFMNADNFSQHLKQNHLL